MSLDPLNVGLSKTCEENLVIAFSWVFILVDDEHDFVLRMQISLTVNSDSLLGGKYRAVVIIHSKTVLTESVSPGGHWCNTRQLATK